MPEMVLEGCTAEPLMSYLKALGVLRLVVEQADPQARGAWANGRFVLWSGLDAQALLTFFLEEYKPTPLVAPWGARSGFYPGSSESAARAALQAIREAKLARLQPFQEVLQEVQEILRDLQFTTKVRDADKLTLMRACRARLPDHVLPWLDATYLLTQDDRTFPPLLGTGGNEGGGSYVSGFAQQVVAAIIRREWDDALPPALFRTVAAGVVTNQTPGHFAPGAAGGANATQGFEGDTHTNPWDYLLTLEGTCLWACGLARRFGTQTGGMAAFPFTVYPNAVGHGALSASDGSKPKGAKREVAEMWLPLWERPASLTEVQQLLAEGRIMIGRRQARTGVDVARTVAGLGIDRGLVAFQRMAFLMRNGQSFLATSLGRFEVGRRREVDLLHQLDAWVERFRRACRVGQRDEAPARFTRALRRIDAAIFDVARYGGTQRMAEILCAMGQAERELATGEQFRATRGVDPIPPLTPDWIVACDDGTVEFRLALALASIRGDREGRMAPLPGHLEAVERLGMRWQWAVGNRAVVWSEADLCRNLTAVLTRRLMDAGRMGLDRPSLAGRVTVTLPDVAAFLGRATDDRRITELLWGLILVDERRPWSAYRPPSVPQQSLWHLLPRAYALLKLVFLPAPLVARVDSQGRHQVSLDWTGEVGVAVKPEPEILGRLKSGDVDQACQIAARRLRAAGFVPMPGPTASGRRRVVTFSTRQMDGTRLAAALMFPVANITRMARLVLRPTVDDPAGSR